MKKYLIIATLGFMMGASAVAQDMNRGGIGRHNQGGRQPQSGYQMDQVVDTAVINHIDLEAEVLTKVHELQAVKKEALGAMMREMRPEKGARISEEQRKAVSEKREAFTVQYRKDLRALIGDEKYILYLEKQLDSHAPHQGMMRGGMNPGQMRQMQNRGNGPRGGVQRGGVRPDVMEDVDM